MDSAMDITNSLRPEDISKGDFFDFVVTSDATDNGSIHSFGRSMKSLGIYLEAYETNNNNTSSNNNNNSTISNNNNNGSNRKEEGERLQMVEQNNNMMLPNGSGSQDYLVHSPYWNGPAISGKDDPGARWESSVLEDLNCWSQDGSGSSKHLVEGENTDGAIYTLTVLNGSDQSSTWYRLPDSAVQDDDSPSPHPQGVAPPHVQGSIDLDSLINNIIPSPLHQASGSTFTFHPSTTTQPQDVQPQPGSETTSDQGQPAIKNEFTYDESGFTEGHQMQQNFGSTTSTQPSNSIATSMVGTSTASTVPAAVSPIITNPNTDTDWGSLASGAASSQEGVDSLLRSALQGKSSISTFSRYNGSVAAHNQQPLKAEKCGDKEPEMHYQDVIGNVKTHSPVMCAVSLETGAVVMLDGNASSGSMLMDSDNTHSVDDIFLSHLDSVTYEEDYEKLKSIEHEVANSMEQYCNPYLMGGEHVRMSPLPHMDHTITLNPLPSITTTSTSTATTSKSAKKYKRSSSSSSSKSGQNHQGQIQTPGVSSAGSSAGIRKERSLHYCTICSKGFKDKYSVNVHIRTHTGEKPFTCTLCGKSFRQKAHLAKHYHTHLAQAKNPTSGGCSSSGSKPSSSKSR